MGTRAPLDRAALTRTGATWGLGLLAAVVALGPVLAPGALLNLDLVVVDAVPVPHGVWGLGPELPRRLPFMLPFAWSSSVLDGPLVVKVGFLLSLAAAAVGAGRLVGRQPALVRAGAGLLYGLSPFLLTRLAVGHLGSLFSAAVLPWVAPTLSRPDRSLPRTFLACVAMGFCGIVGGLLAGIVLAVALISTRRRPLAVLGCYLAGQLPWLVPGLVVSAQGVSPAAAGFGTDVDGVLDVLAVLGGHGFWQSTYQIGHDVPGAPLWGVLVAGLALYGHRSLPAHLRTALGWSAIIGLGWTLASATPGIRSLHDAFTSTALGQPLREGQRLLVLYLLWAAPACALGAVRLAAKRRGALEGVALAVVPVLGLMLAGPGLWGLDGQVRPVDLPDEWAAARAAVAEGPGTVMSLPWQQYHNVSVAGGRRVHTPMPFYLGDDVLIASDPHLGEDVSERADGREDRAHDLVNRIVEGEPVAGDLAALGVRWVVLQHDIDWRRYAESIQGDPGLALVVEGPTLELHEVQGWTGAVVTDAGDDVALDPVISPFAHLEASGPATWYRPAADGWLRGWDAARVGEDGLLRLPAGRGPVWYWPALVTVVADLAVLVAVALVLVRWRRRSGRPQYPAEPVDGNVAS